jgi:hypothetical protein
VGGTSQDPERRLDIDLQPLGKQTLRLFDPNPAAERGLQVFGQHIACVDGTLLQQTRSGDVRQRLPNAQFLPVERSWLGGDKLGVVPVARR